MGKTMICKPLFSLSRNSTIHQTVLGKRPLLQFCSAKNDHKKSHQQNQGDESSSSVFSIGSPCRVQKLIASQSDPLLAKEIFDLACRQPYFHPSFASFQILILKLARSKHFSLVDHLLVRVKSGGFVVTPSLFSSLIKIYEHAGLPDKAFKTFYTMLELNCKPLPKHLNRILNILVSQRNYIRSAFDLFKDAHRYGVSPNSKSYNIMMRAFCSIGDLSIAYSLFNQMFKREVVPDVESYRILMQGLCRKSQVNTAVDLLENMLNKGYIPDALSYSTLLNALCRKKKLKEAYKLLCRMKVKGCNPDILHYNTVILGFCREGRAAEACKILEDMQSNECLPNLVSYRTLVSGLCDQGVFDEAKGYIQEMVSKGFSPHFSVSHGLIQGFCGVGKVEDACGVMEELLNHGEVPHRDTWEVIMKMIWEETDKVRIESILLDILKVEVTRNSRIVDVASYLEGYVIGKIRAKSRRA